MRTIQCCVVHNNKPVCEQFLNLGFLGSS